MEFNYAKKVKESGHNASDFPKEIQNLIEKEKKCVAKLQELYDAEGDNEYDQDDVIKGIEKMESLAESIDKEVCEKIDDFVKANKKNEETHETKKHSFWGL